MKEKKYQRPCYTYDFTNELAAISGVPCPGVKARTAISQITGFLENSTHFNKKKKFPVFTFQRSLYFNPRGGTILLKMFPAAQVNYPGAKILTQCTGQYSWEEISAKISQEFVIPLDKARNDVKSFLLESIIKKYVSLHEHLAQRSDLHIWGNFTKWVPSLLQFQGHRHPIFNSLFLLPKPAYKNGNLNKIMDFLKFFRKQGGVTIYFLMPEVFNNNLWSLIECCAREEFEHLRVGISNGSFTGENVDTLINLGSQFSVFDIRIPLWASKPALHDRILGQKGAFNHTLHTINMLAKKGCPFDISMPVIKSNENDIKNTAQLAKTLGASQFRVKLLASPNLIQLREWELSSPQFDGYEKKVNALAAEMRSKNFLIIPVVHKYFDLFLKENYKRSISLEEKSFFFNKIPCPLKGCGIGYNVICLACDGTIKPCSAFPGDILIGNILAESPDKIYERVQFFLDMPSPNTQFCMDCPLLYSCFGCPAKALINKNHVKHCFWETHFKSWLEEYENNCKR